MRSFASILLLACFTALATGGAEYLHNLDHAREDAAGAAAAKSAGLPDNPHPPHDDTNCPVHAQLHVPIVSAAWAPLLVMLGLFVAFLTLLTPPLASQRVPARTDCRGPPAR